jgi:hypothetical protein
VRDVLARRLAEECPGISGPDLNDAVLSAILQVLFLRHGQDGGIVMPGTLNLLAESDGIGKRMARACSEAGLSPATFFGRGPESSRPAPAMPDDVLRELIRRAVLPGFRAPIPAIPSPGELAAVLDRFLGTRLEVGEGYRVIHAVKSAVLYTGTVDVPPPGIADYTVARTLQCVTGDSPSGSLQQIRLLDPACGAGVFLLAMFRSLASRPAAGLPEEILSRSIFGTDIDHGSVSAARFCLLIAFIEESGKQGGGPVHPSQVNEVCKSLVKTIRCGNALVAPDYFSGRQVHPFNAGERAKVNPLSWDGTFPAILAAGGFDAVIGAPPPYRPFAVSEREKYFQAHYDTYAPGAGLYTFFIEKGICLTRPAGCCTFIVPGTFLRSNRARPLRRLLLTRQILAISSTGLTRMLEGTLSPTYVLQVRNTAPDRPVVVTGIVDGSILDRPITAKRSSFTIDQGMLGDGGWKLEDTRAEALIRKLRAAGTPLDHYVMGQIVQGTVGTGTNPFVTDAGTRDRLTKKDRRCRRQFIPLLSVKDIRRYVPERPDRFVIAGKNSRDFRRCRAIRDYLGAALEGPAGGQEPTGQHPPSGKRSPGPAPYSPKIIFAPCQQEVAFTYDHTGSYAITTSLLAIEPADPYLAGILNSALARFLVPAICQKTGCGYDLGPASLGRFPVITPDFDRLPDKSRHDRIVALVMQVLALHEYLQGAKTAQQRRLAQQEIDATDVKIDALVYDLYGLSPEEISFIEEHR